LLDLAFRDRGRGAPVCIFGRGSRRGRAGKSDIQSADIGKGLTFVRVWMGWCDLEVGFCGEKVLTLEGFGGLVKKIGGQPVA
jgi:hypothetical protein